MVNRSQPPRFKIPEKITLTPPQKRVLRCGIPLYFIPSPEIEAVKIELIFPINHHILPVEKTLVPFFMLHMILEGTKILPSDALDDFFDFHASEVEILTGYENHGLGLLTTRKHLKEVIPVFRSLFTEAIFPEKELNKRKSQKKLSVAIQRDKTSSRANQLFRKMLFGGDHPFGYNVIEEDIDAIEKTSLVDFYQQHFLISPEIFITGQLDEIELQTIEKAFEDLPFNSFKPALRPFTSQKESRFTEIKPGAVQASIRLGKMMIPKSHADYHALTVFNTFLGGYFGSRLIKNIREEKGYTYGINSFLGASNQNEYWMVLADVKEGFGEAVIEEVYKEIEKLRTQSLSLDEFEIVRNYMVGNLLAKFSSPFDLMNHFKNVHFQGMNFNFYQKQLEHIKSFEKEEVNITAEKYFQQGSIKEIIVGSV